MLLPAARLLCGELGVHTTLLTVPAETLGAQVALVAAPVPTFVQVAVNPVKVCPGLTTLGVVAPNAADMSDCVLVYVQSTP